MNKAIRQRSAGWAAVTAAVACGGIAPEAISHAWEGNVTGKLGWTAFVAIFAGLAWMLEGVDAGRSVPHRNKVNQSIAKLVMETACTNSDCPQRSAPSKRTRSLAMSAFYKLIDKPSREVAFHQWGWYYTSIQWMGFSLLGILFVLGTWAFVPTSILAARVVSVLVLICMLILALIIRRIWARKTLTHSGAQVQQIAADLPGSVRDVECADASCPLK
jgi:hypothetical protein